jgi:cytochrome c-type biogenesis protein CcmE
MTSETQPPDATAPAASVTDQMRRRTRRFMVLALAVAGLALTAIAAGVMNRNLVYYWTPTDLEAAGNKAYGATIRLGGMVAKGSVHGQTGVSGLEFDVKDAARVVHVKSAGVPPQMFRENVAVVVEGTMTRGGYFQCNRLMVSHSNEYRAPKGPHKMDKDELQKMMRTTVEQSKS